jgi:hypothetical protein
MGIGNNETVGMEDGSGTPALPAVTQLHQALPGLPDHGRHFSINLLEQSRHHLPQLARHQAHHWANL